MKIGIAGLGLIGGSIGLALRDPRREVVGYDAFPEAAELALKRFCVDQVQSLEEVCQADVIFVAVPPSVCVSLLAKIAQLRGPETIVTDCTSVKAEVAAWAKHAKAEWFVPGHPMAGHEKGTAAFASAWMFRGATWLLTPTSRTKTSATKAVGLLIEEMGAKPARLDAEAHDAHVALTSHLPHVVASALAAMSDGDAAMRTAGPSWRDMTRVAESDPELWTQISLGNRAALAETLGRLEGKLAEFRGELLRDVPDAAVLRGFFESGRSAKVKTTMDKEPQ